MTTTSQPNQLALALPGEKVRHVFSGVCHVIAKEQSPVGGLEWLHGPETVYVVGHCPLRPRIPRHRFTLEPV